MNTIVHYPENSEKRILLQKKVASIHAQSVISYIKNLKCSDGQKQKLVRAIEKIHQEHS